VAAAAIAVPLAFRRRCPLSTLTAVFVAYAAAAAADVAQLAVTTMAGALAIYSAAAYGHRRRRTPVLAGALVVILAVMVRHLVQDLPQPPAPPFGATAVLTFNLVVLALPWGLGAGMRSLRESLAVQADQARQLRAEREARATQAVIEERVRIARDLHDVVAHHVSLMGVQAGAARVVMTAQPEAAAAALRSVEESSRQAVQELHDLIGFLRQAGDEPDDAARPDLSHLPDLVGAVRRAGLEVELRIDGDPGQAMPPLLHVSAYRIVQEALTNTVKHAGASRATVHVRHRPQALEVEIIDDGQARAETPSARTGHGLLGMRERARLHGGDLSAGPRAGGGFAVSARLPIGAGTR